MFKKSLSLLLSGALLCSLFAAPSLAKTKEEEATELAAKVKAGIARLGAGKESRVSVKLRDKSKLTGYISRIGEETFVVTNDKTGVATEIAYPNVSQVKGNNMSVGAVIAIGVVAAGTTILILFLIAKANGA